MTRGCSAQRFELSGTRSAFEDAYETVLLTTGRRDRLDKSITELAADSEFSAVASRLACLRGISTLSSVALAVEIGQWDRFTGSSIGAYLGLVPTERTRNPITKQPPTYSSRSEVVLAGGRYWDRTRFLGVGTHTRDQGC
jgi:transposase